jgi:phosphatidylinositol alpha-1,6-mannosyltransferase
MSDEIKRSLLFTLEFPPNIIGGITTYYYNVCKNLPPDKIVILAPQFQDAQNFDGKHRFKIIRKKLLHKFPETLPKGFFGVMKIVFSVRWISMFKYFVQTVKTHDIQLIQVGQFLPVGTLAMIYKKRKNIPYIVYAHGIDILIPQKFMRKNTLLKSIISHAKGIIANSNFTRNELIKLGAVPDKIKVVNPCPNMEANTFSEFRLRRIIDEQKLKNRDILLTVGRLVERKGHDKVIEALPEIIKKVPNVIYLICGKGPHKKKLISLVNKNNLSDYVKFLGQLPQEDLTAYYQLCDVFIMPSRQLPNGDVEGFGIVFIEANLFGKPVIGGRSGGIPEAILDGQTGVLVNPIDIINIADAAIQLLTDKTLSQRLGQQGQIRARNDFDWKIQTEKIKEILKS